MTRPAIPFDDFGGRGVPLHFAHANAYPPGAYRALLTLLAEDCRVWAVRHRPLWPGSRPEEISEWQDIADDLIHFFDQEGLNDVIGVGHSLGAVTTMMAALKRPELFRALVLIEPVFLPQTVLDLLVAGAALDEPYETPLVKIARKRRKWWPSQEDAFSHYRSKKVFGRWSDEALRDYVRYGTVDNEDGGVSLFYSPEWEARIYTLPPTGVWEMIPQVTHPTLAIRGQETDTLTGQAWLAWQEIQPSVEFKEIQSSGHLLPMERPDEVASAIRIFIAGL
jgi:pimeloyl-ACP methyl ester carboxylesterase